jgi:hypothetical protein
MAKNQSKKSKKHGRSKAECQNYRNTARREKNKIKKLEKHLIKFPDDVSAKDALTFCIKAVRGY